MASGIFNPPPLTSHFDTLDAIIRLAADPKGAAKVAADMRANIDEFRKLEQASRAAAAEAAAQKAEADAAVAQAASDMAAAKAAQAELSAAKDAHGSAVEAHGKAVAAFNATSIARAQDLDRDEKRTAKRLADAERAAASAEAKEAEATKKLADANDTIRRARALLGAMDG